MKGKGRSRQAILAAVTVLAAAQAGTAYASTGPASESGVQTGAWIQEGQDWKYQGTDGTLKTGWVKTESGWDGSAERTDDDWMDHSRWTAVLYEHNCRWRGRTDAPRLVER